MEIFVDYDATITDRDTFDVLVQREAGRRRWQAFESHLHDRAMTLREVLAAQAALITCTLDEADAFIQSETVFDPAFAPFVVRCRTANVPITILSSGVAPLIERALSRNGLSSLPVRANEVDVRPDGWIMRFRDDSENGHDKAAAVREARARGSKVVYIGDGFSDFDAAMEADLRFAKCGRALARYLTERNVPFNVFISFDEVSARLFPTNAPALH